MFSKVVALFAILTLLTACGENTREAPEPPAKGVKIGKPYKIMGKWYTPEYDPSYEEEGIASWYGPGFHGRLTANGEEYDQEAISAAHPTLPLPSIVKVTNLENGREITVRVNDRGPFHEGRIIDLSLGAARLLGVDGIAKVRVTYLSDETQRHWAQMNMKTPRDILVADAGFPVKPDGVTPQIKDAAPLFSVAEHELAPYAGGGSAYLPNFSLISSAHANTLKPQSTNPALAINTQSKDNAHTSQRVELYQAKPAPLDPKNRTFALASNTYSGRYEHPGQDLLTSHSDAKAWFVQVASFKTKERAESLYKMLPRDAKGFIETANVHGETWYRVRAGPYTEKNAAVATLSAFDAVPYVSPTIIQRE